MRNVVDNKYWENIYALPKCQLNDAIQYITKISLLNEDSEVLHIDQCNYDFKLKSLVNHLKRVNTDK